MNLAMRYKSFVWPNNPARCSYQVCRRTAIHKYPGSTYSLEDLGEEKRILSGSGEFYGQEAYSSMKGLLRVYEAGGPGRLLHPVIELQNAYLVKLTFREEPRENYVAYEFTFLETRERSQAAENPGLSPETHTVTQGQTLWEIAALYGTTAEELLAENRWISNPNTLPTGGTIWLS